MPRTAYTPTLPGLTTDDDLDTVINWGLGADSTAYLARMLTDPAAYGIDLERTAVPRPAYSSTRYSGRSLKASSA